MEKMKIEINKDQPLDEVVATLESKGYRFIGVKHEFKKRTYVCCYHNGYCTTSSHSPIGLKKTTLAELKEMK